MVRSVENFTVYEVIARRVDDGTWQVLAPGIAGTVGEVPDRIRAGAWDVLLVTGRDTSSGPPRTCVVEYRLTKPRWERVK